MLKWNITGYQVITPDDRKIRCDTLFGARLAIRKDRHVIAAVERANKRLRR